MGLSCHVVDTLAQWLELWTAGGPARIRPGGYGFETGWRATPSPTSSPYQSAHANPFDRLLA